MSDRILGAGLAEVAPPSNGRSARLRALAGDSLLVALLTPFLALTHEYAQKTLLAIVILDIPFQFGTHLFYRESEAALGALGGLSISATTIALLGLYISWLLRSQASGARDQNPAALHFNTALLLYLVANMVSMFVAQDTTLAFFDVALLLEACLAYFYIANNVKSRQDVTFLVVLLLTACGLESAVIIVMRLMVTPSTMLDLPIHLHVENMGRGGLMRIGGTVGSSNFAAAYLSLSLATAVGVLFADVDRIYKILAATTLAGGVVALILTFSRGGWIALALSVMLLCVTVWHRRRLSWRAPVGVILLLALLYLPFHTMISGRLTGDDQGSAESRIPLMNLAFRIIKDHPILGVGANNFTVAMNQYLTSEFRRRFLFAVHNKYLLVMAETGIGGLLAFLAFLMGTVRKGWDCWNFQDRLLSPLALGFIAGIAGHMVHMTVDVFRGRPTQQLIWVIAGLVVAIHRIGSTPPKSESPTEAV